MHSRTSLRIIFFVTASLGALPTREAAAWSESGHHLIALLAFDRLRADEQQAVLELLSNHPRYAEDFTPPSKVADADRFRIGTAGYWPDIARELPDYNRPTWHYQLGATLTLGDMSLLRVPETPGPLPAGSTLETQELYIAQAVALCRQVMQGLEATPADKAIALCWLAHLVGDAHQPCHAGSLYAAGLFPDGDRGANSIPTHQKNNMHALWDGLLGGRYNEGAIRRRLESIAAEAQHSKLAQAATSAPNSRDPHMWLDESREAANKWAYTSEVLAPVSAAMKTGSDLEPIYFSEAYLQEAGRLARLRAVQAGSRLAVVWKEALVAEETAVAQPQQ